MVLRRRQWIAAATGAVFGFAHAEPARMRRIGVLSLETPASLSWANQQDALRQALRRYGLTEGEQANIDWRLAQGRMDRLAPLAADLERAGVEVIVALYTPAAMAAASATTRTPIVAMGLLDPVALGLAQSLARPGRNVTGTVFFPPSVLGKIIETTHEALPRARRMGILANTRVPGTDKYAAVMNELGRTYGLVFETYPASRPEEVMPSLRRLIADRPDVVLVIGDSVINPSVPSIAAYALEHKLPTVGTTQGHVRDGALLAYTTDLYSMSDRTASYVARVLAGAKPGELPIEEPTRYELVVNLKSGAALSWQPPPSLRPRIDRFIE